MRLPGVTAWPRCRSEDQQVKVPDRHHAWPPLRGLTLDDSRSRPRSVEWNHGNWRSPPREPPPERSALPRRRPVMAVFPTTQWSRIARAVDPDDPEARAALEGLCRDYWYPLYALAR